MCRFCDNAYHTEETSDISGTSINSPTYNGSQSLVSSVTATASQNINGLLFGTKWATAITFGFPTTAADYGTYSRQITRVINGVATKTTVDETTSFSAFNATMQSAARQSFAMLNAYITLAVTEASTPGVATIRMGRSDSAQPTAYAYYPTNNFVGGDVWMGTQTASSVNTNPIIGNYAYATMIHEIGHSMGLKHGHEAGGPANVAMAADRDSMEFTIMTYRSYINDPLFGGYSNETWGYAQTYMMYDIAALQTLYGADFGTNNGDTIYRFSQTTGEMYINNVGQGAPGGNRVFRTIWDGNGIDTYDFSNYSQNQSVDLRPGQWSLFSTGQQASLGDGNFARANVYNALEYQGDTRSLIENAYGGAGDDTIIGNAGANVLFGGGGQDVIFAFSGDDTVYGGDGNDRIWGVEGDDSLLGGNGDDFISGDNGNDYLVGGTGADSLYGYAGTDSLQGDAGVDYLIGGTGTDFFYMQTDLATNVTDLVFDFNFGGEADYLILKSERVTLFYDYGGAAWAAQWNGSGYHYNAVFGVSAAQLETQTRFM